MTIYTISRWNFGVFQKEFWESDWMKSVFAWPTTTLVVRVEKRWRYWDFPRNSTGFGMLTWNKIYDDQHLGGLVADSGPWSLFASERQVRPSHLSGSNPSEDRFWWGKLLILYCIYFKVFIWIICRSNELWLMTSANLWPPPPQNESRRILP